MVAVVERRHTQAHDNSPEHTHLQGLDAAHGSNGAVQNTGSNGAVRKNLSRDGQHSIDGYMHNKKCNHGGKGCHLFLSLGHADGNSHCKYNGKIVKYDISRFGHDDQKGV